MSKYVDCVALEDDKVCSHMQISKKKKGYGRELRDNVYYWLLSLPAVLYFFIFCYLPMFGVVIAFKNYNYSDGILGSEWVGFRNFKFFFTSQDALVITRNTVCYGIAFMITGIITSVLVALLLFEIKEKLAIKMYQTIIILPNFLSWVIVSYITYILLDPRLGVLNH